MREIKRKKADSFYLKFKGKAIVVTFDDLKNFLLGRCRDLLGREPGLDLGTEVCRDGSNVDQRVRHSDGRLLKKITERVTVS